MTWACVRMVNLKRETDTLQIATQTKTIRTNYAIEKKLIGGCEIANVDYMMIKTKRLTT